MPWCYGLYMSNIQLPCLLGSSPGLSLITSLVIRSTVGKHTVFRLSIGRFLQTKYPSELYKGFSKQGLYQPVSYLFYSIDIFEIDSSSFKLLAKLIQLDTYILRPYIINRVLNQYNRFLVIIVNRNNRDISSFIGLYLS